MMVENAVSRRTGKPCRDNNIFGSSSDMEASPIVRMTPRSSRALLRGDTQARLFGEGEGRSTGSCTSLSQSPAPRNTDPGKATIEGNLGNSSPSVRSAGKPSVQRPKGK